MAAARHGLPVHQIGGAVEAVALLQAVRGGEPAAVQEDRVGDVADPVVARAVEHVGIVVARAQPLRVEAVRQAEQQQQQ